MAAKNGTRTLGWETLITSRTLPKSNLGSHSNYPSIRPGSIELYQHLLTDFGTRRDRINRWLEQTTLVSRSAATLLRNQLDLENPQNPSNWSKLVMAYWEQNMAHSRLDHQQAIQRGANDQDDSVRNIKPATSISDGPKKIPSNVLKFKHRAWVTSKPNCQFSSAIEFQNQENSTSFTFPLLKPLPPSQSSSKPHTI